ncbi:unnamed protein product [Protopolystoma xenopodis]|uniref:EF-hand domain-containing protein n=1 Tax=Protopolystoma xenopodis TaxID=117903 RepID=A0A448XLF5_9PLAT|nr:unnamed protein product [Protopolystoma xenopodis]
MKPEELMEHETEEIRKGFKYFDRTAAGFIKTEELGTALRWIKLIPSSADIDRFIALVDPNHTGKVKWESFLYIACQLWISDPQQREAELWQAFLTFDKNDKGKMTPEQLRSILLEIGENPLTEKEVNAIIKDAVDKENMIEYGYLIRSWQK